MSERNCTEPSCCNVTQWPDCAQTAGMPPLLKVAPTAAWENNSSPYSHYEESDPTPWRYTHPATD